MEDQNPFARVWIDGQVVPGSAARVPVFDRGFLYGDSVYEVLRTVRGEPLRLAAHLERLAKSAGGIGMELPHTSLIEGAIRQTLAALGEERAYLRVVVTRGAGALSLDPRSADRPRLIVIAKPLALPDASLYRDGARLALTGGRRNAPGHVPAWVKSGNYLSSVMALGEAKARGAYEALLLDPMGRLAEGASSNFYLVREGVVSTPSLSVGILPGITRQVVLGLLSRHGVPVREAILFPADIAIADEAFLSSSIRGVLPVSSVDDMVVGDGRPGPLSRRLMEIYGAEIGEAPPC